MIHVLAGDVGGTKTLLCLYRVEQASSGEQLLSEVHKTLYHSADYPHFSELIGSFLADVAPHRPNNACLGVAGPVHAQRCDATNLPWVIDARKLANGFDLAEIHLLNDLEAAAHGMLHLAQDEFVELNPNAMPQQGHAAVIAAGTGLGEAIIAWDGRAHVVMPSEGGHADFGPNTEQEDALNAFLRERFDGHVSYERILAGDGFGNLYDFLRASGHAPADPGVEAEMQQADRNAVISQYGLAGDDPLCTEAVRLFARIYGREAGNCALNCLPRAGLYVGGGIAPKIRKVLESGEFMQGFLDKGRMRSAIQNIPVRLSLNPEAPLLGAAHMAATRRIASATVNRAETVSG